VITFPASSCIAASGRADLAGQPATDEVEAAEHAVDSVDGRAVRSEPRCRAGGAVPRIERGCQHAAVAYGSVSVVHGGSGWTAARIGVGGLGDSLRIWPPVGVPFV
jgi:hypothetical protein